MLLGQELELPFLPNMASLIPPRLLLQILLCAQCSGCSVKHTCFKCGGGHTISHCPRLDQGQSQAQLMNPKILPTPANAVKLAQYLEGYDSVLSHKIISGFMQGFELDYTGERKSLLAPNLAYAREFPEVIDSKIQSEVAFGRIVGPFDTPPPWTHCGRSPPNILSGNTEWFSICHTLKSKSVNYGLPQELSSVHYATVDIKSAFRIIPVHPSDYQMLDFLQWKARWYVDHCLPMGYSALCRIFKEFSTSLELIARHKLGIQSVRTFWMIFWLSISPSLVVSYSWLFS